jgi:hypothetical protein
MLPFGTAQTIDARASTAVRAAEQATSEEAAGAGLVEFGLIATATVADPADLRAADAEIANLAASARLRFRVARGQQAAAFAAGLPAGCCRGCTHCFRTGCGVPCDYAHCEARMEAPAMWRGTSVQVCGLWPFSAGSGSPSIGAPLG